MKRIIQNEIECQNSEEYIPEHLGANKYKFDEDRNIIKEGVIMATLADLKRFLQIGQEIKLVYRNKKLDGPIPRIVTKIQTNGVYLKNPFDEKSRPSWLEFPKASLLSFDKTGIRIYTRGIRPLTQEEKEIREGYEKIRNKKQEEIDILTDGSSSYYQETSYYKSKNAYYLMGNTFERGMKYDYNIGQIWDDNIRGNLTLEYVF